MVIVCITWNTCHWQIVLVLINKVTEWFAYFSLVKLIKVPIVQTTHLIIRQSTREEYTKEFLFEHYKIFLAFISSLTLSLLLFNRVWKWSAAFIHTYRNESSQDWFLKHLLSIFWPKHKHIPQKRPRKKSSRMMKHQFTHAMTCKSFTGWNKKPQAWKCGNCQAES